MVMVSNLIFETSEQLVVDEAEVEFFSSTL